MTAGVVDICIVAGRRPDLLGRTIDSFRHNLLGALRVGRVIANIDPIFGGPCEESDCRDVILKAWPHAAITTPDAPNFCAAIRRNWAGTSAEFVFHLEDDWDLNERIEPTILDHFSDMDVAQVILHSWHLDWPVERLGRYCEVSRSARILGARMPWKQRRPMFPTSPSFFRGPFVREVAGMLDPRFDADRQMREWKLNPALVRKVSAWRAYIYGDDDRFPITDTGRQWRAERNIRKLSSAGASVWTSWSADRT